MGMAISWGEHEESFSTAFKQFKTIGAAGDIEFNFAVLGILMKAAGWRES